MHIQIWRKKQNSLHVYAVSSSLSLADCLKGKRCGGLRAGPRTHYCRLVRHNIILIIKGCEIKEVISLPGINFETNSAQLTASSSVTLDAVTQTLNNYPEIYAEVAGHTDSTGSDSYNTKLSEQRAAAVRTYLTSRGVSSSRLTSKGYGENNPIADNSTKEGRAANRRVELKVSE